MDHQFTTFQPIPRYPNADWTRNNPWRHPGSAKVFSPCGINGGEYSVDKVPGGAQSVAKAHPVGKDARDVDWKNVKTTEWQQGATVEAAFAIGVNHGGGYTYRLCKRPPGTERPPPPPSTPPPPSPGGGGCMICGNGGVSRNKQYRDPRSKRCAVPYAYASMLIMVTGWSSVGTPPTIAAE